MNMLPNIHNQGVSKPAQFGYQIAESEKVIQEATQKAFHLVLQARRAGNEIRQGAMSAARETHTLAIGLRKLKGQGKAQALKSPELEGKLKQILYWENEILRIIRHYFGETSSLIGRLKSLNPPLTTAQLEPFMQAIISDRAVTIRALDPLTGNIEELTRAKMEVTQDSSQLYQYRPTP